jgi:hypothetical protein
MHPRWLRTDEVELWNRSRGLAFAMPGSREELYVIAQDVLSDGRPGEQPVTARYTVTQMPHQLTIDFGHNRKVVVENWDGKITAQVYDGDEMPRRTVNMKVGE